MESWTELRRRNGLVSFVSLRSFHRNLKEEVVGSDGSRIFKRIYRIDPNHDIENLSKNTVTSISLIDQTIPNLRRNNGTVELSQNDLPASPIKMEPVV